MNMLEYKSLVEEYIIKMGDLGGSTSDIVDFKMGRFTFLKKE
jgi:hypothetical protein